MAGDDAFWARGRSIFAIDDILTKYETLTENNGENEGMKVSKD